MATGKLHTFPRAEKLKSRKQIDLLFREGKSFFAAPVKCYFKMEKAEDRKDGIAEDVKRENDRSLDGPSGPVAGMAAKHTDHLKAGFSASKRQFKKATDRNRIKRLMREAWRLHKYKLKEQLRQSDQRLEVFLVFTDRTLPTFDLVEEKIKYCLRRLCKMVEEVS